ncbi:MAG: hypothetical protein ACRDOY_00540, partial [Nocardioidaceae bacterium]
VSPLPNAGESPVAVLEQLPEVPAVVVHPAVMEVAEQAAVLFGGVAAVLPVGRCYLGGNMSP